jgi:hypothetical protein
MQPHPYLCNVFLAQDTSVNVKSSGSAVVPADTSIKAEGANDELPSFRGALGWGKTAALEMVDRKSSVVVWADSQSDYGGARNLARKLVDQLKKDFSKKK